KKIGESIRIGAHAQILSEAFRQFTKPLANSNTALILCNQRKQGGIGQLFVSSRKQDAALGGEAIKFHPSQRLKMSFVNLEKAQEAKKSHQKFVVTCEPVKNKISPSRLQARLVINLTGDVSQIDIADSFIKTMQKWGGFSSGKALLSKGYNG